MTRSTRGLLLAAFAGCLVPSTAAVAAPTLRIEGSGATLLPETAVRPAAAPTTLKDADDSDEVTVPAGSATSQLAVGAAAAGLPLGFQVFDLGSGPSSFITRIGPDAMPTTFSPSWRLTVNHAASSTGSDSTVVGEDDRLVWAFVSDFAARELDLQVNGDVHQRGAIIEVTVSSYATDGTSTPAQGATVVFGGRTATTGSDGRASFLADTEGNRAILATRSGEVRSPARVVCTVFDDPAVCGLPVPAPQPAPTTSTTTPSTASTTGFVDSVAPGSIVRFPRIGRANRRVRGVAGTAGPDRSDIRRVDVAVARRVGTQCRFVRKNGRFTPLRACANPLMIQARLAGGNWLRPLRRTLEPGSYRVWSRATDGAGNTQTRGIPRISAGQFRVVS